MKKFYVLPGFGESTNDSSYKKLIDLSQKKDFKSLAFNPTWTRKTVTDWINEFKDFLKKNPPDKNSVAIGFSFGAYILALSATEYKFKKIIFCSLSPYFKDDLSKLPKLAYKILGKKRMSDFKKYSFPQNIASPAVFLVGEKDLPLVIARSKKSFKSWQGHKKFILVKNAGHDLGEGKYLTDIEKEL